MEAAADTYIKGQTRSAKAWVSNYWSFHTSIEGDFISHFTLLGGEK